MGKHYFLKIILSTSMGVLTRAQQCTGFGGYIIEETRRPAVSDF
jgi:hypothetical protein